MQRDLAARKEVRGRPLPVHVRPRMAPEHRHERSRRRHEQQQRQQRVTPGVYFRPDVAF